MLDQWIEATIFRDHVEDHAGSLSREATNVVRNMEIESVTSVAINLDVLRVWPESLQGTGHLQRNLSLVGTNEHLDLERTTRQQAHVLGLNVLEINQDKMGLQAAPLPPKGGY